jgi:hypothetical protein
MTRNTFDGSGTEVDGDEILVELPSRHVAESLCDRLGPGRVAHQEQDVDCWEVGVPFGSALELAQVLRTVEAWIAERALGALRYHLDGRAYILRAGEIAWSSFAREPVVQL